MRVHRWAVERKRVYVLHAPADTRKREEFWIVLWVGGGTEGLTVCDEEK